MVDSDQAAAAGTAGTEDASKRLDSAGQADQSKQKKRSRGGQNQSKKRGKAESGSQQQRQKNKDAEHSTENANLKATHKTPEDAAIDAYYEVHKRVPERLPRKETDIYVARNTDFNSALKRAKKVLDNGGSFVDIHGLGATINKALNLALQLDKQYKGVFKLSCRTSTVVVVDDLEPTTENLRHKTRTRNVSALHVHLYREEKQQQ
eukprot:Clim_evm26s206 gene=Clim_evmTU26s206